MTSFPGKASVRCSKNSPASHPPWGQGRQAPFDPVLKFKVLVLQKFHGLSDDSNEEQIIDRTSFKNFLGLRIGDDIPDAKTLWDFKQRMDAEGRKNEPITPLKSPPKRTLPAGSRGESGPKR